MKHFEPECWADFARGFVGETERAAMEAHLSGCASCRRTADVMARFGTVARGEAAHEVPADVLRRARALFALRRPEKGRTLKVLARQVWHSGLQPLPAGVRSASRPSQALYEAFDFSIDLHLTRETRGREAGPPRLVLVGQIADRRNRAQRLADVPVRLVSGREIAACAVSNRLGEFYLEYDPRKRLRLQIPLEGRKTVEIPLSRLRRLETP